MPDSRRTTPPPINDRWPDWLRDLWGPEPEGPRLRAEAIARDKARLEQANRKNDGV